MEDSTRTRPTGGPTQPVSDEGGRSPSSKDAEGAPFALTTGTLVGRYVIVDQLGAGGMGTVYVGYDSQLARRLAIKVLRPDIGSPDAQARLLFEAQTMARLAHPNVLAVHDVGTFGDGVFIAMEFIDGRTLKTWLKEAHPWREALAVLVAAGRGLEAAHAAGIVHRDFKPANVFLGNDGRVVVGDFGIARAHDDPPSLPSLGSLPPGSVASVGSIGVRRSSPPPPMPTLREDSPTGAMVGTIGYMAPESAFERRDDPRSDQFSFCVTLYRALYGQPPFPYHDLSSYMASLLEPPRAAPAGTGVPAWVHAIVMRGLSHEPADRFASMSEPLEAFGRDPTRRRRWWALGACGGALVVMAGLAVGQRHRRLVEESRAGESLIAATWGAEARARVTAGINVTGAPLASDLGDRTLRLLDAYAIEWARVHREASEATLLRGEQTAAAMQGRLACLEGDRDELGALVGLLARADHVIALHALSAASSLPAPRRCLEPEAARAAALPEAPAPRARVTALRRSVAEADALVMAAKFQDALDVSTRALVEARAIPDRETEAELLIALGEAQGEVVSDSAARDTLESAFAACEAAGNDSLAAMVAATVSLELGDSLADVHEAERWLAIAKGIRAREGNDERADAQILESSITLLSASGHPDKALPLRDQLIALLERIFGPSHPRLAAAISNKGGDYAALGRPDLAVVEYRRAIAMQERLFGPDVPFFSVEYNNIGWTLTELGRFAEARQALDRSVALVAPLGPENAHAVLPLTSLATLDNRTGDPDAALAVTARGLAIIDATGESAARFLPTLLIERGHALLAKGDAEGARAACEKALRTQEAQEAFGGDKIYEDDAITCLGSAELALGRTGAALAYLERSVSITKRSPPTDLSLARFALARALGVAKRDPLRAHALGESAASELHAAVGMERESAQVDAWLASTGPAPAAVDEGGMIKGAP